jgi:cell division protein FtsB
MTAADLKQSTDALNASITKFLAGMDAMQANLDKYADEVAALTARITELEAKAK